MPYPTYLPVFLVLYVLCTKAHFNCLYLHLLLCYVHAKNRRCCMAPSLNFIIQNLICFIKSNCRLLILCVFYYYANKDNLLSFVCLQIGKLWRRKNITMMDCSHKRSELIFKSSSIPILELRISNYSRCSSKRNWQLLA